MKYKCVSDEEICYSNFFVMYKLFVISYKICSCIMHVCKETHYFNNLSEININTKEIQAF